MNLILAYDTETTSLPLWKEPSGHPDQPHIVQLAARLVDADTRRVISTIDLIVRPSGWEIPADVTAIHGISNKHAIACGVEEIVALNALLSMWQVASFRLAFNESFDARIVRIAMKRYGYSDEDADAFKAAPAECAMWLAQKALGGKRPTLGDAHQRLLGTPIADAHSALGDTDSCLSVYWAAKQAISAAA